MGESDRLMRVIVMSYVLQARLLLLLCPASETLLQSLWMLIKFRRAEKYCSFTFKAIDRSFVRYVCLGLVLFVTLCTRLQKQSFCIAMSETRHALSTACGMQARQKTLASLYGFGAPDGLFLVVWCTYVAQKAEKALNNFRAMNYLFREMPSASSAKRKRSRNEKKKNAKKETQRV